MRRTDLVVILLVGGAALVGCHDDSAERLMRRTSAALDQCEQVADGLGQPRLTLRAISSGIVPDGLPAGAKPGLLCTLAAADGTLHSVFVADDGTQISLPDDAAANSVPPTGTDG